MKKRRLATGALSVALALTMVPAPGFAAAVGFTDVPAGHWAYASISAMEEKGIMSGVGNGLFAPDTTVSYAQFATMIARSFYNDQIEGGGDKWYSSFMATVEKVGALEGTKVLGNDSLVETGINRYEMAQVMYNVMSQKGVNIPNNFDTSKIGDWSSIPTNYQKAVSACYSLSTLSGTDSKGTFSGTTMMTRAQAAVVMDRLLEVCSGASTPEKPEGAMQLTEENISRLLGGGSKYENGVFYLKTDGFEDNGGYITFDNAGYSTLTFTVTVHEKRHSVNAGGIDGIDNIAAVYGKQDPETTKTYTADISGCRRIQIGVYSGRFCNAEVTNIYLS